MTVTYEDVTGAARRIAGHALRTPVLEVSPGLFLKLEQLQHAGSFKARGAFNRILSAGELPPAGVIAASGGNHGLAVAHAARALGVRAEIFVPEVTSPVKVAGLRALGAQIRQSGALYAQAAEAAAKRAAETGALAVHAYDQPEVVAGQGTLGLELTGQVPGLDTIIVAVGGGGLVAGVTVSSGALGGGALGGGAPGEGGTASGDASGDGTPGAGTPGGDGTSGAGTPGGDGTSGGDGTPGAGTPGGDGTSGDGTPGPRIVAVEPELCPTLHEALRAGEPVQVPVSGVAADALGASRVGGLAYGICSRAAAEGRLASVLVPDEAIVAARRALWERHRVVAEHAGAAAYAALLSGAYTPAPGERVAVVVCGANTDPSTLNAE
ncbi:pyridoxal-phosphate dependent enzyme [Nonomuraea roseoviolacea]|uniref:Threonine dehydratase n=1 Tax=Nonomuraea roseoviolacea subsp. carminata TaxID=160689 RepID=A0ABT1JS51_9ACTN|nr:pyridoxal-phosphate dependent enzyme [Nonomuraea roseoviolacea]MCP2344576.1 threonine dehydratase [Nonomuraea roseoviolacea subsp. carminata]